MKILRLKCLEEFKNEVERSHFDINPRDKKAAKTREISTAVLAQMLVYSYIQPLSSNHLNFTTLTGIQLNMVVII